MSPELIAAFATLLTASGTIIVGVLATRSKVKLDDIARLHEQIDELKADLAAEKTARDEDAAKNEERHNRTIAVYEQRLAAAEERLASRDRTINRLDLLVLALRTYVARLRRALVDNEVEVPTEPDGMAP